MLESTTDGVIKELQDCAVPTSYTREVTVLRMSPDIKHATIKGAICNTTKEYLENELSRRTKDKSMLCYLPVTVKMIDMTWFTRDG